MPSIAHMLDRTITVTRPSALTTKGSTGYTYGAHLSGVPCRIHHMSTSEVIRHGGERGEKMWRISVESTSANDILENDRITYTDVNGTGRTAEVIESRDGGEQGVIKVVLAREVT